MYFGKVERIVDKKGKDQFKAMIRIQPLYWFSKYIKRNKIDYIAPVSLYHADLNNQPKGASIFNSINGNKLKRLLSIIKTNI